MTSSRTGLAVALLVLLVGTAALATPGPPPDPRRGERLDGRAPPRDPKRHAYLVPRLILAPPRYAARLILVPLAKLSEAAEVHHVYARTYWALTAEDNLAGVRPLFHFESGQRPVVGLRAFDLRTLGPGSLVQARFEAGALTSMLGELLVRPVGTTLLRARYERVDDARFAGIHGESEDDLEAEGRTEARYGYDRALAELDVRSRPTRPLLLRIRAGLDLHRYRDGRSVGDDPPIAEVWCSDCSAGIVDETLVPGFNEGTRRVRGLANLALDTRRHRRHGAGLVAELEASWAHGVIGDPSHDLAVQADVGVPFDLHDRSVLLRVRAGVVEPLGDTPVPFHHLLVASGTEGVRGLGWGRLRGSSILVGTAEYRWLLAPLIDASLFVDWGGAFDHWFEGIDLDHLRPAVGMGLRIYGTSNLYWARSLLGGAEIAWTPGESVRLLFTVSN